jgi:hypothetical protein
MASLRTQNALLFVIALCLVLLVVHFYSGHLVAQAQAAEDPTAPAADGKEVHLYGCLPNPKNGFACSWLPVRVDEYGILRHPKK